MIDFALAKSDRRLTAVQCLRRMTLLKAASSTSNSEAAAATPHLQLMWIFVQISNLRLALAHAENCTACIAFVNWAISSEKINPVCGKLVKAVEIHHGGSAFQQNHQMDSVMNMLPCRIGQMFLMIQLFKTSACSCTRVGPYSHSATAWIGCAGGSWHLSRTQWT